MSDQGFNFNPPPRREAKKGFEPPPWERDQFEELARRREAEKPAAELTAETSGEEPATADSEKRQSEPLAAAGVAARESVGAPTAEEDAAGTNVDEDPRIEAMMIGLRKEEPPFGTELWKAPIAAGAVLVAIGAVLTMWGVVAVSATRRTGVTGSLGGAILVVFGLGFVGVGGWMAFRVLRQRGVL